MLGSIKKNWQYGFWGIIFLICVYIIFKSSFPSYVVPAISLESASTIQGIVYRDVIQYNVAYLTLAITFLFVLAGAFYFFNMRPLEKEIDAQQGQFDKFKSEVEEKNTSLAQDFISFKTDIGEKVLNLKELEKRLMAEEERLQIVEDRSKDLQMQTVWNQHFLWRQTRFFANDAVSLIFYLELMLEFFNKQDKRQIQNTLDCIEWILLNDNGSEPGSVFKFDRVQRTTHLSDLMRLLPKITDKEFDVLKARVQELALEKWSK